MRHIILSLFCLFNLSLVFAQTPPCSSGDYRCQIRKQVRVSNDPKWDNDKVNYSKSLARNVNDGGGVINAFYEFLSTEKKIEDICTEISCTNLSIFWREFVEKNYALGLNDKGYVKAGYTITKNPRIALTDGESRSLGTDTTAAVQIIADTRTQYCKDECCAKEGKFFNPKTGKCECLPGEEEQNGTCISPLGPCPTGQIDDGNEGCVTPPPAPCPTGQTRDSNGDCVTPPPAPCPTGQTRDSNGDCVTPPPAPCPTGQTRDSNGDCVTPPPAPCPTGQTRDSNGDCVTPPPAPCPTGQTRDSNGDCVCPTGTELNNGQCVKRTCPNGQELNDKGECVPCEKPKDDTLKKVVIGAAIVGGTYVIAKAIVKAQKKKAPALFLPQYNMPMMQAPMAYVPPMVVNPCGPRPCMSYAPRPMVYGAPLPVYQCPIQHAHGPYCRHY